MIKLDKKDTRYRIIFFIIVTITSLFPLYSIVTYGRNTIEFSNREYLLLNVDSIAVDSSDRIYIYDNIMKTLRVYDVDGRFLYTLAFEAKASNDDGGIYIKDDTLYIKTDDDKRYILDVNKKSIEMYDVYYKDLDNIEIESYKDMSGNYIDNSAEKERLDELFKIDSKKEKTVLDSEGNSYSTKNQNSVVKKSLSQNTGEVFVEHNFIVWVMVKYENQLIFTGLLIYGLVDYIKKRKNKSNQDIVIGDNNL